MNEWKYLINNNVTLWNEISKINYNYKKYNFEDINCQMAFEYSKKTSGAKFTSHFSLEPTSENVKRIFGIDRFDFGKFLTQQILDDIRDYKVLIDNNIDIFNIYIKYKSEISSAFERLKLFKKEDFDNSKRPKRSAIARFFVSDEEHERNRYSDFLDKQRYEEEILKKHIYNPQFPYVVLHLSAVTPWNYYHEDFRYEFADILECYKRAMSKKGQMTFIEQQRRMVTDSLRYDVMRRDGFRCCICGATAKDGVNLEVDHIIPVSKGGRSTLDNLQTLCERCNRGKRDKQ